MDIVVSARFFRVSNQPKDCSDFPDLLLAQMAKPIAKRERDIGGKGLLIRVEHCEADGEFISGQFCRKQTTNIPPQAGPDGLTAMVMEGGKGLGHMAAFRYHRPTRSLLLQTNIQSASPGRISAYLTTGDPKAIFTLRPILREDALERFKDRKVRGFSVSFASPENLQALDDAGIASAKGARLLAEAFNGLNLTITVRAGRSRKRFLDRSRVGQEIQALLGSSADIKNLEVFTSLDEDTPTIDFLEEHLKSKAELTLPDSNPEGNYEVRKSFLKSEFDVRLPYLKAHFEPSDNGNSR